MRTTIQKRLLNEEVKKQNTFFNAEDIYNKILIRHPTIGIATVYRFLKQLEEKGEIHSFLCENRKIYSLGKKNHAHFTCEKCNEIKHIIVKKVDFLKESIEGELCHLQIDATGICKKCLKKISS